MAYPPEKLDDLRKKIISDEVKIYHDLPKLMEVITKLKTESDEAIENFTEVIIGMTYELSRVTGDHMLASYKDHIIAGIKVRAKNVIDGWIMRAYKNTNGLIRELIIKGDDDFFMNNNLDEITHGNDSMINYLFQFKGFWKKLKPENQAILKTTVVALCIMADIRYINFNKYIYLKDLNPHFADIFSKYDDIF